MGFSHYRQLVISLDLAEGNVLPPLSLPPPSLPPPALSGSRGFVCPLTGVTGSPGYSRSLRLGSFSATFLPALGVSFYPFASSARVPSPAAVGVCTGWFTWRK